MWGIDIPGCHIAPLSWPVDTGVGDSVQLLSQFRYDLSFTGCHSLCIAVAHWKVHLYDTVTHSPTFTVELHMCKDQAETLQPKLLN